MKAPGLGILAACLLLAALVPACRPAPDAEAITAAPVPAAGVAPAAGDPAAPPAAVPSSPARLLRGPEPRRGLPFFGPNALPALRGEFGLGPAIVPVWSCREKLVLGAAWRPVATDSGARLKARLLDRPQGPVLAFVTEGYVLFFELPQDIPAYHRFALSLESRFQVFFQNAVSDAELSFPAFVDFRP